MVPSWSFRSKVIWGQGWKSCESTAVLLGFIGYYETLTKCTHDSAHFMFMKQRYDLLDVWLLCTNSCVGSCKVMYVLSQASEKKTLQNVCPIPQQYQLCSWKVVYVCWVINCYLKKVPPLRKIIRNQIVNVCKMSIEWFWRLISRQPCQLTANLNEFRDYVIAWIEVYSLLHI